MRERGSIFYSDSVSIRGPAWGKDSCTSIFYSDSVSIRAGAGGGARTSNQYAGTSGGAQFYYIRAATKEMEGQKENKFATGQKVRLISGSPTMTVREYVSKGNVQCDWFSSNDHYQKTFLEDQLEESKSDPLPIIGGNRGRDNMRY